MMFTLMIYWKKYPNLVWRPILYKTGKVPATNTLFVVVNLSAENNHLGKGEVLEDFVHQTLIPLISPLNLPMKLFVKMNKMNVTMQTLYLTWEQLILCSMMKMLYRRKVHYLSCRNRNTF